MLLPSLASVLPILAMVCAQAALLWCLAVQECAMYVDWPGAALRYWPEEWEGAQLLFRGPRCAAQAQMSK